MTRPSGHTRPLDLFARGLCAALLLVCCTDVEAIPSDPDTAIASPDTVSWQDVETPDGDDAPDVEAPDTEDPEPDVPTDSSPEVDGPPSDPCEGFNDFGCPCEGHDDCNAYCIEGADGGMCTTPCEGECPAGFDCKLLASLGDDPVAVCVPQHVWLCRPCKADTDCDSPLLSESAFCLPAEDPNDGSFCGSACSDATPCPEGYDCEAVTLAGGGQVDQCRPSSGACTCRDSWDGKGFETVCGVTNALGTCDGYRTCGAEGLTACDAATPAEEVCNAIDDDCDGETDVLAPTPCELVGELGTCEGWLSCGDDGEITCAGAGAFAEVCNGLDDDCDGATDEGACDDGLPCTVDSCGEDGTACVHTLNADHCVIDSACVEGGAINPADPCEVCDPSTSDSSWTDAEGAICNDGDACSSGDVCLSGVCAGTPYICDDGLPCTSQVCDGVGGCELTVLSAFCAIDSACVDAGTTLNGGCLICDPGASPTDWILAGLNAPCDDGDLCTVFDACSASGSCAGAAYSCDDGKWCTTNGCDGLGDCTTTISSGCLIEGSCQVSGTAHPSAPCQACQPAMSQVAWTAATGPSCDDGNLCSYGDACVSGSCLGQSYSCNDGLGCTTDSCDGLGGCSNPVATGWCLIGGTCHSVGATNSANPCEICNESQSYNWSANDGGWCNDGDSCTENDTCMLGGCYGEPAEDSYEPNASLSAGGYLGSVVDDNDFPKGSITASLHDAGDVDWFWYTDSDEILGTIAPRVELINVPAVSNYELCAVYECDDGGVSGTSISCAVGSSTTIEGRPGCCSNNPGSSSETIEMNPSCDCGLFCFDDSGTVSVRVRRVGGVADCSSYTVKWGDD